MAMMINRNSEDSNRPRIRKIASLKRGIVIIKGYSKNSQELKDDKFWIEQYKQFFVSNAGGAYEENEIDCLEELSTTNISAFFTSKQFDFVVIVLIGHGATQENYQLFQLNNSEIILAGTFTINAKKQLYIVESCRSTISGLIPINLNGRTPSFRNGGVIQLLLSRNKCRNLYDDAIKRCNDGIVIVFACSLNETAKNYYFSMLLIKNANNWHLGTKNRSATLNILHLINYMTPIINRKAMMCTLSPQHPQIIGNENFPIAIIKF
jgi:hypothetical protein